MDARRAGLCRQGGARTAADAPTLARCLSIAPLEQVLKTFSKERVAACGTAYETGLRLGRLIFVSDRPVSRDGASLADIETVMYETEVVPSVLREVQARNSS
ncbi:MAG: hypothetical protein OXI01_13565 [Albidovulum sp.]|nr:hypothetical protein [Albidovulum sp.]